MILVTEAGYQGIGGVFGLQHLAAVGFDHEQRFGLRDARRDDGKRRNSMRSDFKRELPKQRANEWHNPIPVL